MKVCLNLSGPELVLLYLAYGNEDAGRIVLNAAKRYGTLNPTTTKRGRKKKMTNEQQGDPFNMTPVSSSQLAAVGFNPETNQGRVLFLAKGRSSGSLYEYDGCSQEEADSIINAPSAGIQFGQTWKGVKPYRKIG